MLQRPEDHAECAVETRSWKASVDVRDGETRVALWGMDPECFSVEDGDLVIRSHHYESLELPYLFRLLAVAVSEAHVWEADCL